MKRIILGILLLVLVTACATEKPIPVEPDGAIGVTPDTPGEQDNAAGTMPELKLWAIECTAEQKAAEACTMEYVPVCGYFSQEVQCIKAPCAQTFGNACSACADDKVAYYTQGDACQVKTLQPGKIYSLY